MEKDRFVRSVNNLKEKIGTITEIVTDTHSQIAKFMRVVHLDYKAFI